MKFGSVPTGLAQGMILAHSLVIGGRKVPKGRALEADDIAAIAAAGITHVTVAALEPGDVPEDDAAARLAAALVAGGGAGLRLSPAHTGRVNLHAETAGLLEIDAERIHGLNRVDPALTLAVLPPYARVTPGLLAGTVKVISYSVAETALSRACALATDAMRVRPVVLRSAGLVLSTVGGVADKLTIKAEKAVTARLRALGMQLVDVRVAAHDSAAMAAELTTLRGDMALILTGAATSDINDTAPQAVRMAGGLVARFGMPVDPGNLLFYGTLGRRPVIGLPGCARSPALNGADWVLERLACGIPLSDDDIAQMGVGGLLQEIRTRPEPRERPSPGSALD